MANGQDTETNATDQETAVDPKLANLVNAAVSSQLKRHMKGLGDTIGATLDEKLSSLGLKPQPAAPQGGAQAGPESEALKEVEKLRGELKAQKQRAAEKEVFADVRSILSGKVRPEAMDTAIKVLKADGVIKIDARDGTATIKHAELGDLDLNEGLSEWLKGEGALFAPAPTGKKTPVRGPNRAPARPAPTVNDEQLTPAQKSMRDLQARGLSLG
jgi:hypothetical protein